MSTTETFRAPTHSYKITYTDGRVRYRMLDGKGREKFEDFARDKKSSVKSIEKGDPEPINPQR
jgi:hypothetical protein